MSLNLNRSLHKRIDNLKKNIVTDTQKLVRIKSVKGKPQKGMPFGAGVDKALNSTLELAAELGLKNNYIDGYAGQVEIGRGKEIMGILCHLDVVPAGNNWAYPPYAGEIHDNRIYGRGTIDDKGPTIAVLYALKAVKEAKINLNKKVRLILGTNEESGWEGLNYYLEKKKAPDFAFSPDASFPVIHAEKGFLIFKLKYNFDDIKQNNSPVKIKSISGGNAPNMVPDSCQAVLITDKTTSIKTRLKRFVNKTGFKIKIENPQSNRELILKSEGVSAHGSQPEAGQNAISQLLTFLSTLKLPEDDLKEFISTYKETIGMEYYGQSIGCNLSDKISGRLILNVGMIDLDHNRGQLTINIRYPVTYKKEEVLNGIKKVLAKTDFKLEEEEHKAPLHVAKNDPLVTKLMAIYSTIIGKETGEPIAIGGGTYARALDKAVAFGPLFPGQPELAHQKDEYINIDSLIQCTKIYASAIAELATKNHRSGNSGW